MPSLFRKKSEERKAWRAVKAKPAPAPRPRSTGRAAPNTWRDRRGCCLGPSPRRLTPPGVEQ